MKTYLKRNIAKIIGKPPRTIQLWTDKGLVLPDITPPQGKGIPRVYSERNLVEFGMIDIMSNEIGVPLDRIRVILWGLRVGKAPGLKGEFKDFYSNQGWGVAKDLFFCTDRLDKEDRPFPAEFHVVLRDEEGNWLFAKKLDKFFSNDQLGSIMVLKLGAIKLKAAKKVGIS